MRTYIRKLQSKSEDTRKQILVGSLILCMSFVGFVWISSIGQKLSKESTPPVEEEIKPFELFGQSIANTYNNVTASVGKIPSIKKEEEKKEVEVEKQIDLIPVEYQ
ncbi:MAG TPA: hypothetical protein VK153_02195 [Candidatus Paceibacterota bacterium]|nr:hypothetical protein [Candidatus Paceibacterota bacterium]